MASPADHPLEACGITIGYGERVISHELSLQLNAGEFLVILGANACGKSTLLKACARLINPSSGSIVVDGKELARYKSKELAKRLGYLPQKSHAPAGLTVRDLVARGRFSHQRVLQQHSEEDDVKVDAALKLAGVDSLADQLVDELSGGQQQRVWIALVLAQDTPLMLLDEPTTYLDVVHQLRVLDLCRHINRSQGKTVVLVLHDLNQAARYADRVVMMKQGSIAAMGTVDEVFTPETIFEVYGLRAQIIQDPVTHTPMVIPEEQDFTHGA